MVNKTAIVFTLVSISLAFAAGYSVVGVIQSTERVGSSGIVVQPPPPPLPSPPSPPSPPPPPEPTIEIDIFSDAACTLMISSVDWGEVEAGGSVDNVIYLKNVGDQGVYLSLMTENWSPSEASDDMQLFWDYDDSTIDPDEVLQVTLTLAVNSNIKGIDSFGFDIVIIGSAT